MKRAAYLIATLLELAALAGAFAVDYYSRAKLGMNRWLGYHNQKWEVALPVDLLQCAGAIVLFALLVIGCVLFTKRSGGRPLQVVALALGALLLAAYLAFLILFSPRTLRGYYLIVLLVWLAGFIQLVKALVMVAASRSFAKARVR